LSERATLLQFSRTVRQYQSDLSDQSALEIRVRNLGWTQNCIILAFFTENKESEHLIFREFHGP